MIASSRPVFIACAACALGLHIAGGAVIFQSEPVAIAASGAAVEVKQGNAFADLATGVIKGVITTETTATVQPIASEAPPVAQPTERAQTPAISTIPAVQSGPTAVVAAASTVSPTESIAPAPAPTEMITATVLDPGRVLTSQRPARRPEGLAPKPAIAEAAPAPRGNATQNASAGAASNTAPQATATTSGSNAQNAKPAQTAANSQAATNYPGQVMRRISRVRKPNTNARGAVMVSFSITTGGSLSAVSVAQSSGNAQLDQMAVQVVQRAAPFPTPPTGAQTRFSVEITGQ
ncbi:TonB family protein [Loktanella agnita]|uniref:cell envelope integrity protein TolA n=1 Tax=Loktanella agnita TaxID=287097 RepID=UPI003986A831